MRTFLHIETRGYAPVAILDLGMSVLKRNSIFLTLQVNSACHRVNLGTSVLGEITALFRTTPGAMTESINPKKLPISELRKCVLDHYNTQKWPNYSLIDGRRRD